MRISPLHTIALSSALALSTSACVGHLGGDEPSSGSSSAIADEGSNGENQVYAIDVSHWSSEITDAEVACWWGQGVRHVIAGTQNPRITRQQLAKAHDGGMTVDLYVYLQWDEDITAQVQSSLAIAGEGPVGRLWLDAEENPGGRSPGQLAALLDEALDACGSFECGIYTANWWWSPSMAGSTAYSDLPLWYAHYDGNPSMSTWASQAFGGWDTPTGKQFDETHVCGVHVDVNTMTVYADPPPPPQPAQPADGPPPAPTGLYPDDDVQIWTDAVRLMCDTMVGATTYAFQIEYYSGGGFVSYHTYEGSENARKFSPAVDNKLYRFSVRARNADGWGEWSSYATFEYGVATEMPEGSYEEDPPQDDPPEDPPPQDDPPEDPPPQDDPPPPGAPTGVQPANGDQVPPPSISMSCDSVAGATSYRFEIQHYNGSSFVSYYAYEPTSPSQTFYPAYDNRAFRFRVSALVGDTWGPASNWNIVLYGNAQMP